jgi:hypothetical protein
MSWFLISGNDCRTQSGTFRDGDLLVNRDGVRIVSQIDTQPVRLTFLIFSISLLLHPCLIIINDHASNWSLSYLFALGFLWFSFSKELLSDCFQPPPITPTDNQLSLADIDMVKVIGKGSSGIVQLVQHKWTSQFFALKVSSYHSPLTVLSLAFFFLTTISVLVCKYGIRSVNAWSCCAARLNYFETCCMGFSTGLWLLKMTCSLTFLNLELDKEYLVFRHCCTRFLICLLP